MSLAYDLYLEQHRGNVAKGFKWIQENLPDLLIPINGVSYEHQICYCHDLSKDDEEEYNAYDAYFYGRNRSYQVVKDFNYAWLHHIHNNPHHWQYWILINDDPNEGEIIMDMPYNYKSGEDKKLTEADLLNINFRDLYILKTELLMLFNYINEDRK